MKVIGIYSSGNIHGNSATLLREALGGAKSAGAETHEIGLFSCNIGFRRGCMKCMTEGKCFQADDFDAIRQLMSDADGIILSSPTFAAAPNAMMKNFIDRLGLFEYMTSSTLGGKYLAAISTASSFGAGKTAKYLAGIGLGSIVAKSRVTGTLGVLLKGGKTVKDMNGCIKEARALGKKMVIDFNQNRTYPFQAMFLKLANSIIMRPMILGAVTKYKDSKMKGIYLNLKSRGLIE